MTGWIGIFYRKVIQTLVYGLHRDCDFLWVKVLKHKYINEETFLNMKKKLGSVTWNEIMKAISALEDGFEFRLG